ncbi:hypothetical protein SNE40_021928 [Patella caerulea]|uniref:THAP-type domain-containing protein n=1 Tax=Patella caerulea TaxID=87958 RepID=A0AAN8J4E1_PATCE
MMGMKPENLKYARLCSDHFEDSQFMNPRDRTSRLKPKAVPTIINAPNPPKRLKSCRREIVRVIQNDEEVKTAVKNEDIIPVPTETGTMTDISKQDIDALKATIHQLKAENHRLRKKCTEKRTVSKIILLDTLKEYLSPPAYNFVKQQIEVAKNTKNGVRWSDDIKLFALQMKGISTKGYKFLKKIFRLPAIRTLNKPLKSYDIIEGFHQPVVKTLEEITTTMSPKEKLVVLSNDEIALKET